MSPRIFLLASILCGLAGQPGSTAAARPAESTESAVSAYSLDAILDLAVQHNPLLTDAAGVVKQRHGTRIAAGAYPNPSISGSAGRGAIRDPSTGVRVTEHTVGVEQPIEWPGKRQARQDAATAGVAEANAALDATRLALLADVKVAFYSLLFAQRDAELATQNVAMVEEVLRTVKVRVAAGEATSFDTMKASVEVQKARKEIARAQNTLLVANARLNTLTAGSLGKQFLIHGEFLLPRQELNIDRLTALAFEQHPTVRRAAKLAEQAEHTVQLERESRVPNISVQGNYHREAGDESLIAGLSVPLPLWYRRQGEIETALGTKYRADAERVRAHIELEQAVIQYVQEARTAQDQLLVFETGLLKQAEQTLIVARTSFRQGVASLLDVLDAQRVYRQTLLEYAQVRADLSIALVRLERSVGAPL
ncbi:MAG: Heavy metal RND efflux outer membrane protein, CzcC family [Nitrospira sp.]|nr:MAG: Heavy metal RND efflux outer membrane protein, CzcC family [Nitrospira sp.]